MARVPAALAVAVLLCFCGLGCGGDDDEDQASPPGTGTQSTATEDEATTTEAEDAEPDQDAGDFLKEIIEQRAFGQNGRAWETLHPLHQEVVSRTDFVNCGGQEEVSIEIVNVEEVEEYDEPLQMIPGETAEVPTKAVTLRIEYDIPTLEDTQTETATLHAVAVEGEWRWILPPDDYEAYEAGECPSSE